MPVNTQYIKSTRGSLRVKGVPLLEFMYLGLTHMPGESYRRRLVELMYLGLIRMPGESYRRRLRSLLCLCYVILASFCFRLYHVIA